MMKKRQFQLAGVGGTVLRNRALPCKNVDKQLTRKPLNSMTLLEMPGIEVFSEPNFSEPNRA